MKRFSIFQLQIPANLPQAVPQDIALCQRFASARLKEKPGGSAPDRCLQQRRKGHWYIDLPDSVVGFRGLNGTSPNTLANPDRGEVARQMVHQFQPESFTDTESGSCQERKQDLVPSLCSRQNLFDFEFGQRRFDLFFLVYDRKADEMEIPVAGIELLAFARHG